jgi:hypothetical protein
MALTVAKIVALIKSTAIECQREAKPPREYVWVNERGNTVYSGNAGTDRYIVDFAEDFTAEGWMQFDTRQDAHYFGVWMNPAKLLTLTYCEGDWSLVECPDAAHYNAEVQDACDFYSPGIAAITCSSAESATALLIGGEPGPDTTVHVQDRREFFRT